MLSNMGIHTQEGHLIELTWNPGYYMRTGRVQAEGQR